MKLLLAPTRGSVDNPANWLSAKSIVRNQLWCSSGAAEVHCVGGGSLLLWLLLNAQRSGRKGQQTIAEPMPSVIMYGEPVLPTPESVGMWSNSAVDPSLAASWKDAGDRLYHSPALKLPENRWLSDISETLSKGDFLMLADDLLRHLDFWDAKGCLNLQPAPSPDMPHPITGRTRAEVQHEKGATRGGRGGSAATMLGGGSEQVLKEEEIARLLSSLCLPQ